MVEKPLAEGAWSRGERKSWGWRGAWPGLGRGGARARSGARRVGKPGPEGETGSPTLHKSIGHGELLSRRSIFVCACWYVNSSSGSHSQCYYDSHTLWQSTQHSHVERWLGEECSSRYPCTNRGDTENGDNLEQRKAGCLPHNCQHVHVADFTSALTVRLLRIVIILNKHHHIHYSSQLPCLQQWEC